MKSETRLLSKRRAGGIARLTAGLLALTALAGAADVDSKIASLETAVKSAQSAGDNAWMLVSAALVLMMTGPGPGAVLRRPGPPQECARHHDAQLHPDGAWSPCSGRSSATAWPSAKATPFIGDLRLRCS